VGRSTKKVGNEVRGR